MDSEMVFFFVCAGSSVVSAALVSWFMGRNERTLYDTRIANMISRCDALDNKIDSVDKAQRGIKSGEAKRKQAEKEDEQMKKLSSALVKAGPTFINPAATKEQKAKAVADAAMENMDTITEWVISSFTGKK